MQGLRERSKDQRRRAVLLAARDLIADAGIDALTMRTLAERAGVSVPTIYGLIGPRDAVIGALLTAGGDLIDEGVAATADPIDRVFTALELFSETVAANESIARSVFAAGLPAANAEHSMRDRVRVACAAALADARAASVVDRRCDPVELAELVDALLVGTIAQWATGVMSVEQMSARLQYGVASLLLPHATATGGAALERYRARAARTMRAAPRRQRGTRTHRNSA